MLVFEMWAASVANVSNLEPSRTSSNFDRLDALEHTQDTRTTICPEYVGIASLCTKS